MLRALSLPVRLLLPLLAIGCEVAAVDSVAPAVTVNSCQEDQESDCTKGIATCENGRCVATKGSFSTILLDISVPASGTSSSGLSYLWREDNVNLTGEAWDIQLAPVADVVGRVLGVPYVDPLTGKDCALEFVGQEPGQTVPVAEDGSIPVDVVFSPADRVLGIESAGYTAKVDTSQAEQSGSAPGSYDFQFSLPKGEYDMYIKPRAGADGACQLPPWLYRREDAIYDKISLGLTLPVPSRFDLSLKWPSDSAQPPPEGWTVEMLDPISGKLVSTRAELSASGTDDLLQAVIYYFPAEPVDPDKSELLRLTPPEDVIAPTVVLARSALELFSKGSGLIDQFQSYPDPVRVQAQVTTSDAAPAGATVTLTAKSIEGVDQGVFTSFVRTVEVGEDGTFEVDLLPGTYRVLAIPASPTAGTGERFSAATESEWTIAAEPMTQAGKLVQLDPIVKVSGTAYAPQGSEPALGAVVTAVASPRSMQVDLLTQAAEGSTPYYAPSAESGLVGENGSFTVRADPGDFDVSLRPPASSGFSWFVTHYPVRQQMNEPADLGVLRMPYPVPYTGRISVVETEAVGADAGVGALQGLSQALIRAYIYLDEDGSYIDDPTGAASVLQIGETRADRDGQFELLIPANLN
jgi:hypothetical protein